MFRNIRSINLVKINYLKKINISNTKSIYPPLAVFYMYSFDLINIGLFIYIFGKT
jgi:hypothetical protein